MGFFSLGESSPGGGESQFDEFNFSVLKDRGFEEMDFESLAEACRQAPLKSLLESDSAGNSLWHSLARKVDNNSTEIKEIIRNQPKNEVLLKATENAKDKSTILHILASNQNSHEILLDILVEFLPGEKDTILKQGNAKGKTIFHILSETAKEGTSLKTLEYVLHLYKNVKVENPLNLAIMSSNTEGAKLLMDNDYKLTTGLNVLQSSIKYSNPDLVKYVLQKFPDLRLQLDKKGASPLHHAVNLTGIDKNAERGSGTIQNYKQFRIDILMVLLENDVSDVDHQNSEKDNCLHAAISFGFPEAVLTIIEHLQPKGGNEMRRKGSANGEDHQPSGKTCYRICSTQSE